MPELIVITGGPGAGKTALLRELEARGYACADEVAREIIREQVELKGDVLPWADRELFARLMLERSLRQWRELQATQTMVFVDRGLPDTLCYARLVGLSEDFARQAYEVCMSFRYSRTVFIAPAWEEIYVTDAERRQDFDEAIATFGLMVRTYKDCGYQLVELPKASVRERAEFVLRYLAATP
ncbi:MAG TPA: AAA family ATPase [Edaphobacter sp.]